ncbi:MAG: hypothetical protein LBQ39_10105 [Tannerellaceae bacterium]|jgi:hypothetical protein|nr:hypothetical protein [Tannerellaceae bacterium]
MINIKEGLSNQAIGFFPLLLSMALDIYLPFMPSYAVGLCVSVIGISVFFHCLREKIYLFLLLPATAALILFSLFLVFYPHPVLNTRSSLIVEIVFVVVLAFTGLMKQYALSRIRHAPFSLSQRILLRATLDEACFVAHMIRHLYTLHLFFLLIHTQAPFMPHDAGVDHFLYQKTGILIGLSVILYEQVRIMILRRRLRKEMWLPVLDERGRVTGRVARSVSRRSLKKFFHPVVRVAVVYKGMLYLVKREQSDYLSPGLYDYPLEKEVLYRYSIHGTVCDAIRVFNEDKSIIPQFMIRYTFENERLKYLVSLYTICLRTEKQFQQCCGGKLWTARQIEENMDSGIFGACFEKEFPYLQNTILLAESVCRREKEPSYL